MKPKCKQSWEDNRKLCELFFSGVDPDGKRAGVYIDKDDEGNGTTKLEV